MSFLKFGNPVILDKMIQPPNGFAEFLFVAWPVKFAIPFVLAAILLSIPLQGRQFIKGPWFLWLPVAWLVWQKIAATNSVAPDLTRITLYHFVVVTFAFYMGYASLARCPNLKGLWVPLIVAFTYMLWTGFEQHNGGLEAMRKMIYAQPNWQEMPPDYLKRIASNRVFGTMAYPNALAGALLLLLPALTYKLWQMTASWQRIARAVVVGLFAYGAVACLYWSGSKAGWLIALGVAAVGCLKLPEIARYRYLIAGIVLIAGLAVFAVRFQAYFAKGATSASARVIYWQAAWQTALKHPLFGTGPGTFQKPFAEIKPPDAEMARLVHNDYLEQASDSGFPGFILYLAMMGTFLVLLYRKTTETLPFLVFLGILGFSAQSMVEFGLYIPALSWTAFLLMGWGLGLHGCEQRGEAGKPS